MKKGVAFLERDNLVIFYYFNASVIWPDMRGGLSREGQYGNILLF
jgi:hypothetical protein